MCIAEAREHTARRKARIMTVTPEKGRDDPRLLKHSNSGTPIKYYRINTRSCYTWEAQLLIHLNSSRPIPTAALQASTRTANGGNEESR